MTTKTERTEAVWIEQVLLPELDKHTISLKTSVGYPGMARELKQFILSHRDEWKGK